MANSKNTIQNIPLTGELCLNTLKTDVKQFEGYNEKNTTVFGGELTNIRSKKSVSYTDYKTKHLHNSKGDDFEIDLASHTLKKNGVTVIDHWSLDNGLDRTIRKINLSEIIPEKDVYWAALTKTPHYGENLEVCYVAVSEDAGSLNKVCLYHLIKQPSGEITKTKICNLSFSNNANNDNLKTAQYRLCYTPGGSIYFACAYRISGYEKPLRGDIAVFSRTNSIFATKDFSIADTYVSPINLSIKATRAGCTVVLNNHAGDCISSNGFITYCWDCRIDGIGDMVTGGRYCITGFPFRGNSQEISFSNESTHTTYEIGAWSISTYTSTYDSNNNFLYGTCSETTTEDTKTGITGYNSMVVGETTKKPILKKIVGDFHNGYSIYTLGTNVISVSIFGLPVCTPTSIESNNISFTYEDDNVVWSDEELNAYVDGVTYKTEGTWTYVGFPSIKSTENRYLDSSAYNDLIVDNRYILYFRHSPESSSTSKRYCLAYDIETSSITDDFKYLGYIFSEFPVTDSSFTETTGAVYAGGYNSAFEISKSPFTGYLPNPTVVTGIKGNFKKWSGKVPADINTYLSIGDSVMSAEYNGTNPEYVGTTYSIDANANVILPFSASSKIIKGYSNNDLIDTGSSVYPLIYYNNTNRLYSYYLLSSIENMKCAFALQGQQYGVTDENILAVTISNGVISNVSTVAYVKDMTFLGTLPTSAVFYSKLNKTFYRFTGDSILSKMFEASDIDEIGIVGQNPASLSLWICTDKGVYVISDTDMYKLDYKADNVSFCDSFVIIDEDDFDTEQNKYRHTSNKISIYDIGDGAEEQPIKLQTKYYGLGSELKANYDCWYIRLHNKKHKAGKLKLKVNTITNTSFETEEKTFDIEPSMYDTNSQIFIRYQPKYQSAVATQLELESDIAIYQISLGINQTDATAQVSKFNF